MTAIFSRPPSAATRNQTIFKLDNGMKVLIKEDHFSPVVAMQVWVGVGGADEIDPDAGIAHVHEHMLFKGTSTRGVGEIAGEIEASGGRINAWTAWDQTVYHVVLASRYADDALDILADAVQHSSFDPVELHKELGVVMEEYKRGLDMPGSRLFQTLFETAYTKHPYRRPVIGSKESILGITRAKVLAFYQRYYTPNDMTLVIVGDVDPAHMKERIEKDFARFEAHPDDRPQRAVEPTQAGIRSADVRMDVKEAHLALGFHIPGAAAPDIPTLDLLAQILGGGESSRLYDRLVVQSPLATDVSAFAYSPKDPGLFVVELSLESVDSEKALQTVVDELARVRRLPVNEEELERARANLESTFVYRSQTVQGQARELGQFLTIYHDPDYAHTYIRALRAVTPAAIQAAADEYLGENNLTVVTVTPEKAKTTLSKESIRDAAHVLSRDHEAVTWVGADKEDSATATALSPDSMKRPDTPARIVRLRNGARVIVQEHHDVPIFSLRVGMLGGLLAETPQDNGISRFTSLMLTRGTKTRSRRQFAREVESLAGHLDGFSGRNSLGLSGGFLAEHFNEGMDLFLDAFLDPVFDAAEVDKARRETLLAIKNRDDNTATVAFDLTYSTMYPGHPYGMRTLGEAKTVESLTRQKLATFYHEVRDPQHVIFSIVGDIDADEVIRKITARYGDSLYFGDDPFHVPPAPVPTRIRRVHDEIDRAQSHIVIAFPGVTLTDPDRHPVSVLETILSRQGGRLFYTLRDVQGLAYTVTAFSSEGLADGLFGAYIATDPANAGKAIHSLLSELEKVGAQPVAPEELERAQRFLIGSHAIALQTNGSIADEMLFNELYGLGYLHGEHYEDRIGAVSIEDVQRVAHKYIRPDIRTVVTVGPERTSAAPASAAAHH